MSSDTDLLAAETLLLAVVTVVYAVWYPKIEEALGTPRPRPMEQLQDEPALQKRARLRGALCARTIPLLVASAILTLSFLPVAWSLAWAAGRDIVVRGSSSLADYDAVRAALFVAWVFMAGLVFYAVTLVVRLRARLTWYSPNSRTRPRSP